MPTPEEESRKLLCLCGKQHGTFSAQGLELKCRHCDEITTVPYSISSLEQAKAFVQRRRGEARRPAKKPDVRKSRHPRVSKNEP